MKTIILFSLFTLLPIIAHGATIKLSSGDILNAEILEQTDTHIRVKHSVLGVLTIEKKQIVAIDDLKTIPAQTQAVIVAEIEDPVDNGMLGLGWIFPGFDRRFTLGLSGKESNSSNLDLYTAFDANYEDDYKRWDVGLRTAYNKEDRASTDNNFRVYANRDWLNPDSPWRYFSKGQYDWDQFKSWDYRLTAIAGPGYQFIKNDILEFIGRTGLSLKKEYGSEDTDLVAEHMVGFNSELKLARLQTLKLSTEFFTPYEDFGEIRNLSRLDWIYKLTDEGSNRDLSLKVSLDYEYDWQVDPGDKKDEYIYRTTLVLGL